MYACILIPVGFPVLLFILLSGSFRVRNRFDLFPSADTGELHALHDLPETVSLEDEEFEYTTCPIESKDTTQFALTFLHENYKPSYWYWEVIEMYRKLFLTSIMPIMTSQSKIFLGLAIIVSTTFTVLHACTKPIKDSFENWLQLISLSVIPANLCIGYILETIVNKDGGMSGSKGDRFGIGILLLVLNSVVILVLLTRLIKLQIKKCSILLAEHHYSCRCCIACILPCAFGRSVQIWHS